MRPVIAVPALVSLVCGGWWWLVLCVSGQAWEVAGRRAALHVPRITSGHSLVRTIISKELHNLSS